MEQERSQEASIPNYLQKFPYKNILTFSSWKAF